MTSARRIAPFFLVVGLAVTAAACGSSSSDSATPDTSLSADAAAGKAYVSANCEGCHTVDGRSKAGPTFKGLAGSTVALESGQSLPADDAYLVKSIQDPSADIVKGYQQIMESAIPAGSVSEQQAKQIAAYIATLK